MITLPRTLTLNMQMQLFSQILMLPLQNKKAHLPQHHHLHQVLIQVVDPPQTVTHLAAALQVLVHHQAHLLALRDQALNLQDLHLDLTQLIIGMFPKQYLQGTFQKMPLQIHLPA